MDLLEYQGKQLLGRHDVPVPTGVHATSLEEATQAAADLHLGLHDAGIADLVGCRDRLLDGARGTTGGHGNVVAGEQLLALVLEQVHRGREP